MTRALCRQDAVETRDQPMSDRVFEAAERVYQRDLQQQQAQHSTT